MRSGRNFMLLCLLLFLTPVELFDDELPNGGNYQTLTPDELKKLRDQVKNYFAGNVILPNQRFPRFVPADRYESFFYLVHNPVNQLSLTIDPCSTTVKWEVFYKSAVGRILLGNNPSTLELTSQKLSRTLISNSTQTFTIHNATQGLYTLRAIAEERDTIVDWYAEEGIYPFREEELSWTPLTVQKRRKGRKLTIRWNASSIDGPKPAKPRIEYCLVVNTKKNLTSFCEANCYLETPPTIYQLYPSNKRNAIETSMAQDQVKINCMGSKTSFTYSNLEQGKVYYFNLFIRQLKTNLTLMYGSTYLRYDHRLKPIGLKDGKSQVANLRKNDGKVTLRYKVLSKYLPGTLDWYVMPCGGIVNIEVRSRRRVIIGKQQVTSFKHLKISNPLPGQRYVLHITALDRDELNNINGVEVMATMWSASLDTFPELPENRRVKEITSLRECDSVTVGWFPGPVDSNMVRYCIKVTELPRMKRKQLEESMLDFHIRPNQCGLEARLKKPTKEFSTNQCLYITPHNGISKLLTQKITDLRPGREYTIQVTMKKTKSRTLSYDLLKTRTMPTCSYY